MRWLRRVRRRLGLLSRRADVESELADEIRHHIELETEELTRDGWPPAEARREAFRRFGGVDRFTEQVREARGLRTLEDLMSDLRYAVRKIRKRPGFFLLLVLTLGVGIGANTAMFSGVNSFLLRAAPWVNEPDRLVALLRTLGDGEGQGFGHLTYMRYQEQVRSFTGLAASRAADLIWNEDEGSVLLNSHLVSGNYFAVLRVPMVRGRGFLAEEDRTAGTHPVAIVSYDIWQDHLGADPGDWTDDPPQRDRLHHRGSSPRGFPWIGGG